MPEFVLFELILPVAPEAELVAASTAERIASLAGFSEKVMSAMRLAVVEACINAYYEHCTSPDMQFNLTFVLEENKLLVIFRDIGNRSDAIQHNPAHIREQLKKIRPGGWALMTIEHLDHGA